MTQPSSQAQTLAQPGASSPTRLVLLVSLIMSVRMLGLFMLLPVLATSQLALLGGHKLTGLVLGVYGLAQALMQIPLGRLSDRWGRRPIIAVGLLCFIVGSLLAATTHGPVSLLIARAIQGMGAIGSTALACIADHTPDERRTTAMACVGMSIGVSFLLALIIAPSIEAMGGLRAIFLLCTLLGVLALIACWFLPSERLRAPTLTWGQIHQHILACGSLMRMNIGIFSLHAMLTALFVYLPIRLQQLQLPPTRVYLISLSIAAILMIPAVYLSEKKQAVMPVMRGAIVALAVLSLLLLNQLTSTSIVFAVLPAWFAAFTVLESLLPSAVSKLAPIQAKGAAMGVYSSFQFLGIFVGGCLGGIIAQHINLDAVVVLCAVIALLWLLALSSVSSLPACKTCFIGQVVSDDASLRALLLSYAGVLEVYYSHCELLLLIKYNPSIISEKQLRDAVSIATLNKSL